MLCKDNYRVLLAPTALYEGSARRPVANTAPKGVSTAEALVATG